MRIKILKLFLCSVFIFHFCVLYGPVFGDEPPEDTKTVRANPDDTIKAKAGDKADQKNVTGSVCDTAIDNVKAAEQKIYKLLERIAAPINVLPTSPYYRRSELSDNDLKLLKPGRELMDEIIKNRGIDNWLAKKLETDYGLAEFHISTKGMLENRYFEECRKWVFEKGMKRLKYKRKRTKIMADKVALLADYYGSMTFADELLFKTIVANVEGKHGFEGVFANLSRQGFYGDPTFPAYHDKGKWLATGQIIQRIERTLTDRAGSPGHTTPVSKAWGYYSIVKSVKEILRGVYDGTKLWEAKGNRDAFFEEAEITAYISALSNKYVDILAKQDETIRTLNHAWNCKCR